MRTKLLLNKNIFFLSFFSERPKTRDSVQRCNGNIDNDDEDDDDVDDDDTIEDHLDVDDDGDEDGAVDKEEEREAVVQSEVIKRLKTFKYQKFWKF